MSRRTLQKQTGNETRESMRVTFTNGGPWSAGRVWVMSLVKSWFDPGTNYIDSPGQGRVFS
jgi:hypothetical protein